MPSYPIKDSTIEEVVCTSKLYSVKNLAGKYKLDRGHIYWHQVQGQLHMTERVDMLFFGWTKKETLTLQIKKDPALASNIDLLRDFYIKHIIPAFCTELL